MYLNLEKLLSDIADSYGTTPDEVRTELENLIDTCWNDPDPKIHAKWAAMSPDGQRPTIEEVIVCLSLRVWELDSENQPADHHIWPPIAQ